MSQRSDYNVNINLTTKDRTSKGTRAAKKGIGDLASVVKLAAAGFTAMKVAQKGLELVKLGADSLRAEKALDSLAKQSGTSGSEIISAMLSASDFTIDKMSAMSAANKALLLDVAQTPEQFAALAKQATLLGRAMGQDATTSIDDFITAAGRQSKQIADNLGLMVGAEDANLKYAASLGIAVDEMTDAQKKQAFLNEMMRQAEIKTVALDDGTKDLATNMEILNAALETTKTELGELAAGRAAAIVGDDFSDLGQLIRDMPVVVEALGNAWDIYLTRALEEGKTGAFAWAQALVEVREEMDRSSVAAGLAADAAVTWQKDEDELRKTLEETRAIVVDLAEETPELANGIDLLTAAEPPATKATEDLTKALDEQKEAAERTRVSLRKFSSDLGMDFTSRDEDIAKAARDFAEKREQIEIDHQTKMETIQKKGQSRAIKVDETAEWDKLALMEERLEIALKSQSEFSDKTRESTRMAKDLAIRQLQGQIADQKTMLDDYHAGRLIKQGQNISGLLSAEGERYAKELSMLDASRVEQEAAQRESLGRMMLAEFTAWAELKDIAPDAILDMRLDIMEEYGLIDSAGRKAAADMVIVFNKAITDFGGDMDRAIAWWHELEAARAQYIVNLEKAAAKTYDIKVRVLAQKIGIEDGSIPIPSGGNLGGFSPGPSPRGGLQGPDMAFGGSFIAGPGFGGPRWVGEAGRPERVTVQPLIDQSVGTMNINDGQAMAMYTAQRQRAAMMAFQKGSM